MFSLVGAQSFIGCRTWWQCFFQLIACLYKKGIPCLLLVGGLFQNISFKLGCKALPSLAELSPPRLWPAAVSIAPSLTLEACLPKIHVRKSFFVIPYLYRNQYLPYVPHPFC